MPTVNHLVPKIGPEGAKQLSHDLKNLPVTMEKGVDPGPRGPVIRSLGLSIAQLVGKLRDDLNALGLIDDESMIAMCLQDLQILADRSCTYGDPSYSHHRCDA